MITFTARTDHRSLLDIYFEVDVSGQVDSVSVPVWSSWYCLAVWEPCCLDDVAHVSYLGSIFSMLILHNMPYNGRYGSRLSWSVRWVDSSVEIDRWRAVSLLLLAVNRYVFLLNGIQYPTRGRPSSSVKPVLMLLTEMPVQGVPVFCSYVVTSYVRGDYLAYVLYGPSQLLTWYQVWFKSFITTTGVHTNQDQVWLVKIGKYMGFYVNRRSWLLWSLVIGCLRYTTTFM